MTPSYYSTDLISFVLKFHSHHSHQIYDLGRSVCLLTLVETDRSRLTLLNCLTPAVLNLLRWDFPHRVGRAKHQMREFAEREDLRRPPSDSEVSTNDLTPKATTTRRGRVLRSREPTFFFFLHRIHPVANLTTGKWSCETKNQENKKKAFGNLEI